MNSSDKIHSLEIKFTDLTKVVENQGVVLGEIKQILQKQAEIMITVSENKKATENLKDDVDNLQYIFDKRKDVTDQNNKNFADFVSKSKGVLATCLFFFTLLQGIIGYSITKSYDNFVDLQKEVKELHKEVAVMKAEEKIHNSLHKQ